MFRNFVADFLFAKVCILHTVHIELTHYFEVFFVLCDAVCRLSSIDVLINKGRPQWFDVAC